MSPSPFWILGGVFMLVGVGLWWLQRHGPTRPPEPVDSNILDEFLLEQSMFPEGVEEHWMPDENVLADPPPELLEEVSDETARDVYDMVDSLRAAMDMDPWDDPYDYQDILLDEGKEVRMIFHFPDGGYSVPAFNAYGWEPGILESDKFKVGSDTGVGYVDYQNRLILWLHSGLGQTMTPIQNYIELDENGNRALYQMADERVSELMAGSNVYLAQGDDYAFSKISAAVRVPASEVEALSEHVMDLIPYLALTYPDSGFDTIMNSEETLILYFCGRALAGEKKNPRLGHWTQARFIIGLTPLEVVDEVQSSSQTGD